VGRRGSVPLARQVQHATTERDNGPTATTASPQTGRNRSDQDQFSEQVVTGRNTRNCFFGKIWRISFLLEPVSPFNVQPCCTEEATRTGPGDFGHFYDLAVVSETREGSVMAASWHCKFCETFEKHFPDFPTPPRRHNYTQGGTPDD
jgi:hypothetical protein